jgi:VanZ family protein
MSRPTTRYLAILWTLAIVVALAWPRPSLPETPDTFAFDKIVHAGLFAAFGLLWMRGLRGTLRRRVLRVGVLGLLFAAFTEIGQGLLPSERTASPADAVADAAGLLLGIGAAWGLARSPFAAPPQKS